MHSRKRGRSKSHKPRHTQTPIWVETSKEDLEKLVVQMSKEGKREAEIGLILRDNHGIPSVKMITGKTILAILKDNHLQSEYPSDLLDLIKRAVRMRKHLASNKKDVHNRVKLGHVESKIKRLVRFYRGKRLPANWKYDPEAAILLVK